GPGGPERPVVVNRPPLAVAHGGAADVNPNKGCGRRDGVHRWYAATARRWTFGTGRNIHATRMHGHRVHSGGGRVGPHRPRAPRRGLCPSRFGDDRKEADRDGAWRVVRERGQSGRVRLAWI